MRKNKIIFILGGARSGKSEIAVKLARKYWKKVTYVATASAGDDEMKERIEVHKKDRPSSWNTIEAEIHIGAAVAAAVTAPIADSGFKPKGIILDCVTMLVSNIILANGEDATEIELTKLVTDEIDLFLDACGKNAVSCIIVSNETGMGIVPPSRLGRIYRDVLGKANKHIAAKANKVLLMIAGLAVDIKKNRLKVF